MQGLVFCVAIDSGIMKLYDARSFEKGPFTTFTVRNPSSPRRVDLLTGPL